MQTAKQRPYLTPGFRMICLRCGDFGQPETVVTILSGTPPTLMVRKGSFFQQYLIEPEEVIELGQLVCGESIHPGAGERNPHRGGTVNLQLVGEGWSAEYTWKEYCAHPGWKELEHLAHRALGLAVSYAGSEVRAEGECLLPLYPQGVAFRHGTQVYA